MPGDPTPQYVRELSLTGEFDALTDDQIDNVIHDEVTYMYLQVVPEDLYTRVVGLHTAHILATTLAGGGGGGGQQGPLIQAKVDKLEKRWGMVQKPIQPGAGLDESTPYGRRCIRLLRSRVPAMRVAI